MASTYSLTDFSHKNVGYISDKNTTSTPDYVVSIRNVYVPFCGMTVPGTPPSAVFRSTHARRRYIHSATGGVTSGTSMPLERHFPIDKSVWQTPITLTGIDGVTDWVYKGYRGEQDRI